MLRKWCVAGLMLVLALPLASGCKRKEPPKPEQAQEQAQVSGLPAGTKLAEITPEMTGALASASMAPADAAFFQNAQQLGKFWSDILRSRSVRDIVQLPVVQASWFQAKSSNPFVAGLLQAIQKDPVIVEGIPVLKDALANDVFVCGSAELIRFIRAAQEVSGEARALQMKILPQMLGHRGPMEADGNALADTILRNRESLRLPGVLMGFKLADKAAAQRYLDKYIPRIETGELGPIQKITVAGAPFHRFDLRGDMAPEKELRDFQAEMAKGHISEAKAAELVAWFKEQRIVIAVGIVGDYLMISLGSDTAFVERWGKGPSVAQLPALEPVRRRLDRKPFAITYTSPALLACLTPSVEDLQGMVSLYANLIPPDAPEGLKERIQKDASQLIGEAAKPATPSAQVSVSFLNKGIETFRFREGTTALDCSEPLAILQHRGAGEMGCYATHAKPAPEVYPLLAKYARVAYSYFEDYAVPKMDAEERANFEKAMTLLRPYLASLDETTRTSLIPSIDGAPSLVVFNGRGQLTNTPEGEPLPAPFPIPRLGVAISLADAAAFQKAMREYAGSTRTLLEGVQREFPEAPRGLTLPAPETRAAAGGTLYFYTLPWPLGEDVIPCAILKGDLLVLATSTRFAEEMAGQRPMPASGVVDFSRPVGSACLLEWTELWDYAQRATNAAILYAGGPRGDQQAMLIQMHVQTLLRSLAAIRSYRSTTTIEDGHVVTHSWLHVEEGGT